jgi:NitT/TauT family transport system permease protein
MTTLLSRPKRMTRPKQDLTEAEKALRPPRILDNRALWAVLSAGILLGSWEICARNHIVDPAFSSYPSQIFAELRHYLSTKAGWHDVSVTAKEFGYGLILSMAVGIPLGMIMGYYKRIDSALDPLVNFFNASPRIALAPLFVLWFGIGMESKIAVVLFSAVFPLIVNARSGVAGADRDLITMARSWNASTLYTVRTVILPASVPSIAAGIRIGVGSALHGVVLAEFIAAYEGVGFRINQASNTFNTGLMFGGVFLISGLGVLVTELAGMVEKHFSRWRTA